MRRLEAQLQQARATAIRSENEARRGDRLRNSNAISAELAESRSSAAAEARAGVAAIQAQLDLARLNLSFTRVTAPISGRVSRAQFTAGNIVTADVTPLTSVVSTDKVYAYFDADERVYLKYTQLARDGQRGQSTPVYLGLSNETGNPHLGQMNFVDNQVNPKTGTIRGRAVFDNRDGQFTPGLYARLKLVGSATYSAVLINDEAVGTDLGKKFVLVMDKDNKAAYRAVELGPKLEGLRIVRNGLSKDDRIVVKGLQRVRPGSAVDPQDTPMASEATLAALAQQRQALEASIQGKPGAPANVKLVSASAPRG
ncbi:Efflux pump periplasmic linker BepF [compost metagenome]